MRLTKDSIGLFLAFVLVGLLMLLCDSMDKFELCRRGLLR